MQISFQIEQDDKLNDEVDTCGYSFLIYTAADLEGFQLDLAFLNSMQRITSDVAMHLSGFDSDNTRMTTS